MQEISPRLAYSSAGARRLHFEPLVGMHGFSVGGMTLNPILSCQIDHGNRRNLTAAISKWRRESEGSRGDKAHAAHNNFDKSPFAKIVKAVTF